MKVSLPEVNTEALFAKLGQANLAFNRFYPGDSPARQPIHTVYGGAQLFKAESAQKLGALALANLDEYAPNFAVFARALSLPGHEDLPTKDEKIAALAKECLTVSNQLKAKQVGPGSATQSMSVSEKNSSARLWRTLGLTLKTATATALTPKKTVTQKPRLER
jgi:hypothetical protein